MGRIKNIIQQSLEMLSMRKKQQAALILTLAFLVYFGGLFLLFWINLESHVLRDKSHIRIILYWKRISKAEFTSALKDIKKIKHITLKKTYTPAQALAILKNTGINATLEASSTQNPLSYTVIITTDISGKRFYSLIDRLKKIQGVKDVIFSQQGLEIKRAWVKMAKYATILLLIVLAKVMGFIIFISYSLLKSMRAEEIKIMWLVGASRSFIRLPIILNAFFLSFTAFFIGSSLVKLTQITINKFSYTPPLWIRIEFFPLNIFLAFLGTVLFISLAGSYLAVRNIDPV